jgi:signal transduction histidine kinase
MWIRAFRRLGPRYILAMMLVTRLLGSIGGLLTIYYVRITLVRLPDTANFHFHVAALLSIVAAVVATSILARCLTRNLRETLARLERGEPVDRPLGLAATREAVTFVGRQLLREAWLVPLVTTVPVCAYLGAVVDVEISALYHIAIATLLGIALSLMLMFFTVEQAMAPVVRHLLESGVPADFDAVPLQPLHIKLNLCFGVIIVCTATMIGAMASRRARDLVEHPFSSPAAVSNLPQHTVLVSIAALIVGLTYSRWLSRSIGDRVAKLVQVMKRVQAGALSERVQPTGNDEIDTLARQFNAMVEELDRKDRTVRDLNANLERKVRVRTRELARSKRNLQHSLEKLRESDRHKTEFFSNISHELRTPLMMILSPLEQMARREPRECSEQTRSLLGVASVNAQRLLKLINQLLDFAKLESGHARLRPEAVALNEFIERLAASARPLAEQRGLSLALELDAAVGVITADEEKLDTIVTNLISNAIKFTPGGGRVTIRTGIAASDMSVFDDPQVLIEIEDTGIGIDEQNFVRLFRRFSQVDGSTSREFAGTGLGLALVKELVELHEGRVDVVSEPGRGSRFSVTLPARCAQTGGSAAFEQPSASLRANRFADLLQCDAFEADSIGSTEPGSPGAATILVVDDMPEVRRMVGQILADQYRVTYAVDGESGWSAVLRERPDLIISDVMMPRVDGYEFCRRVKQHPETAAIPFVLLTAQAQLNLKIEGLNVGADDYLVKPFNSEELLARIRSLLRLREMHCDISDKNQRLELTLAELQRTQNQLIQAEKMSSLGQLVAGLAHEINNSINAVYNGIPTIIERTERLQKLVDAALQEQDPEGRSVRRDVSTAFGRIRTLASVVEEGANRTAKIIGDMRKFSHPGVAAVEQFDLNSTLDVCVNLLDKQFREQVQIYRDYGMKGEILGPTSQLHQVFLNLLTNAVQAMPQGGDIYIVTRREGDQIAISIRDTGSGIPDEVLPRIFDPFFTTKPPGQGTGLGLSISYGIITRLGGTIDCHSVVGVGTEFIVRLPSDCAESFDFSKRVPTPMRPADHDRN